MFPWPGADWGSQGSVAQQGRWVLREGWFWPLILHVCESFSLSARGAWGPSAAPHREDRLFLVLMMVEAPALQTLPTPTSWLFPRRWGSTLATPILQAEE